jgi:hypothetical protein
MKDRQVNYSHSRAWESNKVHPIEEPSGNSNPLICGCWHQHHQPHSTEQVFSPLVDVHQASQVSVYMSTEWEWHQGSCTGERTMLEHKQGLRGRDTTVEMKVWTQIESVRVRGICGKSGDGGVSTGRVREWDISSKSGERCVNTDREWGSEASALGVQ